MGGVLVRVRFFPNRAVSELRRLFLFMQKTFTIQLTEDEVDTLIMALRYCELHHPIYDEGKRTEKNYRIDFKKLLNRIYYFIKQTSLFPLPSA